MASEFGNSKKRVRLSALAGGQRPTEESIHKSLATLSPLSCLELENQAKNLSWRLVIRVEILRYALDMTK